MIRPDPHREGLAQRLRRRQVLRLGLLGTLTLFLAECGGFFTGLGTLMPGFFRPLKTEAFGGIVPAGTVEELLQWFRDRNDEPFLVTAGRFFVLHPPDGLIAAYRKCTHLGCTVPWTAAEDQFHCPCHGSLFEKRTAVVKGGPAPRPLDLFTITIVDGVVMVDTNPTHVVPRSGYDPQQAVKV